MPEVESGVKEEVNRVYYTHQMSYYYPKRGMMTIKVLALKLITDTGNLGLEWAIGKQNV